jgi:hypothetical protein
MMQYKIIGGLKFKFEPHDKYRSLTYDERWVCDIGHFHIDVAVYAGQHDLHGIRAIVHSSNGWHRFDGETLEQAVNNALIAMAEEMARDNRHTEWLCNGGPKPCPEDGIFGSWISGITYWEDELATAISGKMSRVLKAKIRSNIFSWIGIAIFCGMSVAVAFVPKTYTCSCPCQCKSR